MVGAVRPVRGLDPTVNVKRDFFVSYARSDSPWAEWIAWTLEEAGFTTFLDSVDLQPGADWGVALREQFEGSGHCGSLT